MNGIRPVCVKCEVEMFAACNDVAVWHPVQQRIIGGIVTSDNGEEKIDFVVLGDRYECSKCGASIVTGFGKMMTGDVTLQDYLREVRDETEEKIRILRGGN